MIIELYKDGTGIIHGNDGIKVSTNPATAGTFVVDSERVRIDGLTYTNFQGTGNKTAAFIADDGKSYSCDMVCLDGGKFKPVHRQSEHLVNLKRENEELEEKIKDLTERLEKIETRMNYKGLDFLK